MHCEPLCPRLPQRLRGPLHFWVAQGWPRSDAQYLVRLQYFILAHWLSDADVDIRRMHLPSFAPRTSSKLSMSNPTFRWAARTKGSWFAQRSAPTSTMLIEIREASPSTSTVRDRERNRDLNVPHSRSAGKVELACNPRHHIHDQKCCVKCFIPTLECLVEPDPRLCHPRICVRGSPPPRFGSPSR
jgi:hypothetical protein